MTDVAKVLGAELGDLGRDVTLAPFCAYGVGGPAEFLVTATTTDHLRHAVLVGRDLGMAVTVLGLATNVLVADRGLKGLVVLARNGATRLDGEMLVAGAGASLTSTVAAMAERGLAGLEFAANIPGSVGGAVVGNAGAYGRSVADVLGAALLLRGNKARWFGPDKLAFGYRTSAIKQGLDAVVLEASFCLAGGDRRALLDEIARDAERRRARHPLDCPSCGSYFKNPSRDLPAARLIDDAGLKGLTVGKAYVSVKHANFLIPLRRGTAADIRALAEEVKRRVLEHSGVQLEEEVRLLGFG